jgi:membrane-associated protease RseP (regulator of RpoE activity)
MTSPTLLSQPAHPTSQTARPVPSRMSSYGIPLVLLLVTLFSTTAVGMRYMHNFQLGRGPIMDDSDMLPYAWVIRNLSHFAMGLPFSLALIGILLAHEFGHYFACRAYSVECTLPYMLPAPTLSGTFGAVIRLRSRVRSRAALLVIGASGPISGFIVVLFTTVLGLRLSTYGDSTLLRNVQTPLIMTALDHLLRMLHLIDGPPAALLVPHPILTASWIGLLITSLNLVPAGQLDGGHIVYAVSPSLHQVTSRIVTVVLTALGVLYWIGWVLWGIVLLTPSMRHPAIKDHTPLTRWQWAMALACGLILAVGGTYAPFQGFGMMDVLSKLPGRMHGGW